MRLLAIFGTRPELIKLAPVLRALRASSIGVDLRVCATAQHRDLVDPLLRLFDIKPDIDLDVMRPDQSPSDVVRDVIAGLAPVMLRERPDWVMVQGDTSSTLAAAVAARYAGVRIVHVEAGLRTGRLDQPFPEEANRRLVGAIADLHCAPTERARANLLHEGVPEEKIVVTGNTGIDALKCALSREDAKFEPDKTRSGHLVLVTVHRRESFGAPLEQICLALRDLTERYGPTVHIVWPVHPNPQVRNTVQRMLGDLEHIALVPPVDYLTLVHLLKRSRLVLTDSGGLQEEAPSLGKPVLVMREITERPEGIDAGTARLVGTDRERIVTETSRLIEDDDAYGEMARKIDLYGDGRASGRIVDALQRLWSMTGSAVRCNALIVLILALILGGMACGPASAPPPAPTTKAPAKAGEAFDLRVGGALTLSDIPLTVNVERVSEDSRCPANVTCVWTGDATVRVVLVAGDRSRGTVDVHTMADKQEARFQGFRVRLVKLLPARMTADPVPQEQYVATLIVNKER